MTTKQEHVAILGGSSGIGLAAAKRLRSEGKKVTIAGRDPARLERARIEIGDDIETKSFDATDLFKIHAFFRELGAFDHLVLTFGGGKGFGPFATLSIDELRLGFEHKAWAYLACAQAALETIRRDGSITFISAVSSQMAAPGTVGLAAINGALDAAARTLANEARPLRVNTVSPGVIDTEWWGGFPEERRREVFAQYAAKSPAGRVGAADDIASAISFLISNSFITGHILTCDGGLRLAA